MSRTYEAGHLGVAVAVFRALRGWTQAELAAAARVGASAVSRYESGDQTPTRRTFGRLAAAAGVSPPLVDRLLSWIAEARANIHGRPVQMTNTGPADAAAAELTEAVVGLLREALAAEPQRRDEPASPSEEDFREATEAWRRLEPYTAEDRLFLVEEAPEYHQWALCELVCEQSLKAAADRAERALELAALAVRIAELVPGEEGWKQRLQGYAWAHLANARRVAGQLPSAEEAFDRALALWQVGTHADPGLLSEARLLSLQASLRTNQRRLAEASTLLDQALALAGEEERKKLLLKQEHVRYLAGDFEGAITILREAAALVSPESEPRLYLGLRFNLADNLVQVRRPEESEALLPELRELTARLGNDLDALRLRWLEGRVAGALGRREEAIVALSRVREEFAARRIAYDTALATLELAVLYLEEGRISDVKRLAKEMLWIFKTQGVHREALAALKLFCEAARRETATAKLARRVAEYLAKARNHPDLRFEP
ncbi:MAG TPA: helix-turn-helix transcriptional regulator [Thermoanaerobaculia bacterium]